MRKLKDIGKAWDTVGWTIVQIPNTVYFELVSKRNHRKKPSVFTSRAAAEEYLVNELVKLEPQAKESDQVVDPQYMSIQKVGNKLLKPDSDEFNAIQKKKTNKVRK